MTKVSPGGIYFGTSNITLPGNKSTFPPPYNTTSRLTYYSSLFNSVEINSSFYKIPLARTFARWATEVPAGFRFNVKLWKGITHNKKLQFDPADIGRFLQAAAHLGEKKGCLLIQFPKSITADNFDEVSSIVEEVRHQDQDAEWNVAVEFRHPTWHDRTSWYGKATQELLDKQKCSLVVHDIPFSFNTQPNPAAPFVYVRMHGEKGDYRGSYSDEHLRSIASAISQWRDAGKDVYAQFNNTIGDAFLNAQMLRSFC